LEVASILKSKLLFEEPPQNSFFTCLLQGKSRSISELRMLEKIVGAKPLSRNLLLHMDNYVENNKNLRLLAFLSLLNYKGCVWINEIGISCHWPYT
jgi:hypothetical protein